MKWVVVWVFLIFFLFLAVSSLSHDYNTCQYDTNCNAGYVCVNGFCIPEGSTSGTCPDTSSLRNSIFNRFNITLNDNCGLDSEQLGVIYHILDAVPESLYNVSRITTFPDTLAEMPDVIRIPDIEVGDTEGDFIPDGISQYSDSFSSKFVHELNRNIRRNFRLELRHKENELIQKAGTDHNNYIRSDYPDGFFFQNHTRFFPAISNAYFQDSNLTFHFTLKRLNQGYTQPVNQFLFFADVYSAGSTGTSFYTLDENGVINRQYANLGKDSANHINSLYFQGMFYQFVLDENGSVIDIVRETPEQECQDKTPYGECSVDKPKYCDNGALKLNCSRCGCNEGYECANDGDCVKSPTVCHDGTVNGTCSVNNPYYCDGGNLVENCLICQCQVGMCEPSGGCNHPPVLGPIGNKQAWEGEKLEFQIHASDQDGDPLTFFASVLPEGSSFNNQTGLFSWTPDYGQIGNYWVTFAVVDDSEGPLGDQELIRITIGDVNRPPEVDIIDDIRTDENIMIQLNISAQDPDGDKLYYYAKNLPAGSNFNNQTAMFSWIPKFGQEGNYIMQFVVSDGELNVTIEVMITVGNLNRPPKSRIYHPLESQEFSTKRNVLFSAFGSHDPDNQELTYVWDFGDGQSKTTKNLTTTHIYTSPGKYNVTLTTTDGIMHDTEVITITLKDTPKTDGDSDGVEDSLDKCPDTPPFKRVNIYGCSLPKYTEFVNNITTDLFNVDLENATNITIGVPETGKIEFRKNTINLVDKDINKYVFIRQNNITIDTERIPELNKSAVLTLYNVTVKDPVILRNGLYCPDCKMISYMNSTFSFAVPHFTTYSLMAWASYSGYCGDGMCSLYESCQECEPDCGKCKDVERPGVCEELWFCSPWSECNELNLRTRECYDANLCGVRLKKPLETIECGKEEDYSLVFFGIIVMILVIVYLVAETIKKKAESKKMNIFELEKFAKAYMYRGFTKDEIRKMLKPKGYADKEINEALKEAEKEIF